MQYWPDQVGVGGGGTLDHYYTDSGCGAVERSGSVLARGGRHHHNRPVNVSPTKLPAADTLLTPVCTFYSSALPVSALFVAL